MRLIRLIFKITAKGFLPFHEGLRKNRFKGAEIPEL
jgi:hypothetical protein